MSFSAGSGTTGATALSWRGTSSPAAEHPGCCSSGTPTDSAGRQRPIWEIVERLPIEVKRVKEIAAVRSSVIHSDGIVDALFGTGLDRAVSGIYEQVIELINMSGKPVLSLDIPSGVSGETGEVMGTAVRADHTVTFGLPKIGNMLYPGYDLCGKLHLCSISFPPALCDDEAIDVEINGFLTFRCANGRSIKDRRGTSCSSPALRAITAPRTFPPCRF